MSAARHDKETKAAAPSAPPEAAPVAAETKPAGDDPRWAEFKRAIADVQAGAKLELEQAITSMSATFDHFAQGMRRTIEELEARLATVAAKVAKQEASSEHRDGLARELAALQEAVRRISVALDRRDLLTPPATPAQVGEAMDKGLRLLVLQDFAQLNLVFKAGRIITAQSQSKAIIMDAVTSGRLKLSIMEG